MGGAVGREGSGRWGVGGASGLFAAAADLAEAEETEASGGTEVLLSPGAGGGSGHGG